MATLILPPADVLAATATELTRAAVAAGNVKRQIALNKASYDLLVSAPAIAIVPGGFLVPSSSRAGLVHRVDTVNGCDCEAGRNGRTCRHAVAIELVEAAQQRTMPNLIAMPEGDTLDTDGMRIKPLAQRIAEARAAAAALAECF